MISPYDWLAERLERAKRVADEVGFDFEWTQQTSASEQQILECSRELQRSIGVTLSPGHAAFLRIANGAQLGWAAATEADGTMGNGNTITIFSTDRMRDASRSIYLPSPSNPKHPEWMPQDFWEPTLPCIDLQDANYLALDPRIMTNGEYAIVWAESELGPLYGDGMSYLMPSFETCLIKMLDMIGLCRQTPEFWHARHQFLRPNCIPDNWHWTNFPMAQRYRSDTSA